MKTLKEFLAEKANNSLYVAMKLHPDSADMLQGIIDKHKIPNPLHKDDLHTTLMYSENKNIDGYKNDDCKCCSAKISGIDSFDGGNALVLKLDSPELQARHKELADAGAQHSFNEYTPHITLSYDATDYDRAGMQYLMGTEVKFSGEYGEPIIKGWRGTK